MSLREAVRHAIAESPGAPSEIAERLLKDMEADDLRDALAETLPSYVRVLMSNQQRPTLAKWDELSEGEGSAPPAIPMTVYGDREWKPLEECTTDDFAEMADRRKRLAEGNIAWSRRFARLADGLGVPAPQPEDETPPMGGGASVVVLRAYKQRLLEHRENGTSPQLLQMQKRVAALQAAFDKRVHLWVKQVAFDNELRKRGFYDGEG